MSEHSDIDTLVIQSYLDGELEGTDVLEFERQLAESPELAARVEEAEAEHRALRDLLRAPPAPDSLRDRVGAALDGESRQQRRSVARTVWSWSLPAASVVAAAAAILLFVAQNSGIGNAEDEGDDGDGSVAHAAVRERIRTQTPTPVVNRQSRGEVSASLSRYFSSPVVPPRFANPDITLEGWRPAHLRGFEAVQLLYTAKSASGRHMVSLHVLDAGSHGLRGQRTLAIGGRTLYVDDPFGFSAVSFKDSSGIAYVFTSEMAEGELIDLVASSDLLMR